jgi:hypothetical protein
MISQAVFKMVLPMACAWAEEQKAVIRVWACTHGVADRQCGLAEITR